MRVCNRGKRPQRHCRHHPAYLGRFHDFCADDGARFGDHRGDDGVEHELRVGEELGGLLGSAVAQEAATETEQGTADEID